MPIYSYSSFFSNLSTYGSLSADVGILDATNNRDSNPFNIGFIGAIGVQYDINHEFNVRGEVELSMRRFGASGESTRHPFIVNTKYDYKKTSLMFNVFTERNRGWILDPYLMAGVGISNFNETAIRDRYTVWTNTHEIEELRNSGSAFTWAIGTGMAFDIINSLRGDIGIRRIFIMDSGSPAAILSVSFGVRYTF